MLRQQRLAGAAACGQEWGQKGQNLDAVFAVAAEQSQEIDPAVDATAQVAVMWSKAVWNQSLLVSFLCTLLQAAKDKLRTFTDLLLAVSPIVLPRITALTAKV